MRTRARRALDRSLARRLSASASRFGRRAKRPVNAWRPTGTGTSHWSGRPCRKEWPSICPVGHADRARAGASWRSSDAACSFSCLPCFSRRRPARPTSSSTVRPPASPSGASGATRAARSTASSCPRARGWWSPTASPSVRVSSSPTANSNGRFDQGAAAVGPPPKGRQAPGTGPRGGGHRAVGRLQPRGRAADGGRPGRCRRPVAHRQGEQGPRAHRGPVVK